MAEAEARHTYRAAAGLTLSVPALRPLAGGREAAWVAGVTLAAFAAAELLTTYVDPVAGVLLHAVILSALILTAALGEDSPDAAGAPASRLLYALTVVPLIRILSLSMPLAHFEPYLWYLMAGLPVFLAAVVAMGPLGLTLQSIGVRLSWSPVQAGVIALGFGLGIAEYHILRPDALINQLTPASFVPPALVLLVATGFLEEFLFRGVLQTVAWPLLGRATVFYVGAVFAILHIGYHSATDVAFVFAIALIYGWVVRRTGSIMGVSVSHGITNIMLFLVVPFIPALSS